jgi:Flp pilus assembly protein TadG
MHTRKEVTEMHVAITRAGLALLIFAAVATVLLVLGIAPVETSTAMPPICPPTC